MSGMSGSRFAMTVAKARLDKTQRWSNSVRLATKGPPQPPTPGARATPRALAKLPPRRS